MRATNHALAHVGIAVIHAGQLGELRDFHDRFAVAPHPPEPTDPTLDTFLARNQHRIEELRLAYAAVGLEASAWSDDHVAEGVDLHSFRGDNMFVFQGRGTARSQYVESARVVRRVDELGLVDRLTEDGAFGVTCVDVDSWTVSRDLLDSILEIDFLADVGALPDGGPVRILDIGAGYGRLAHRITEAIPSVDRYLCTDGVPTSTLVQEFYLAHRGVTAGEVIPLHAVADLGPTDAISLGINIHSFPEMPMSTSGWWVAQLARCEVPRVFLVTDDEAGTTALEADGRRHGDFTDHFERHGYRLAEKRPKYDPNRIDPVDQLFPATYWLFVRPPTAPVER